MVVRFKKSLPSENRFRSTKLETPGREGEGETIDDKKGIDPGLSAAERKTLRSHDAQEAIADHEEAQKAFHGNRERLQEERLRREAAAPG
jgi:hypothetical protein